MMGDFNINYKNKKSPNHKKFDFFARSNSLTQYINSTTRNTDNTKSLIDLALSNPKFVIMAGTLDYFISDHQPIYIDTKRGGILSSQLSFPADHIENLIVTHFVKN